MRVWLTGGTGFVGSNIVHAALGSGAEVMTTVHSYLPDADAGFDTDRVDMTDGGAVLTSVQGFQPDAVIHCAILNDFGRLYSDRKAGWDAYVTATANTAAAAAAVGASFVVVSTDWVFDGTQGGADETTPPNPINVYGTLKMASEITALERGGAVARISGVNGIHRALPEAARAQDPGFGYFVASLVDDLRVGDTFTVWEADNINMIATPSLASESAGMILDIGRSGFQGVFHCCGADATTRMELARAVCEVFDLDSSLLRSGPFDSSVMLVVLIPYDTSITSPRTSELLVRAPTSLTALLERFRDEYETAA